MNLNDCVVGEQDYQLDLFIFGSCGSCDYVGYFSFVGVQEGFKKIKPFELYNCECGTTLSRRDILKDVFIDEIIK